MVAEPGAEGPPISLEDRACERFEPPVDCATCGACCREAFDSVPVSDDEPIRVARPHLVVDHADGWRDLARVPSDVHPGRTRCAALTGNGEPGSPYRCSVYACRPTPCRELEEGSENCLLARRRVGLSAVAGPAEGG